MCQVPLQKAALRFVFAALILVGISPASFADPGDTTAVSVGLPGKGPLYQSFNPSISADGRWVTFSSSAPDFVPGDTNATVDIFLWDTLTNHYARLNVRPDGTQSERGAGASVISSNGRYVAFLSQATDLTQPGGNGLRTIYVRDLLLSTTSCASASLGGAFGNGDSTDPVTSYDGRYVAFRSRADNLVDGDTNGLADVFLKDMVSGTVTMVSSGQLGVPSNGDSVPMSISPDGRFVAFASIASNLVTGDLNGVYDCFVRDLHINTTTRISVASSGLEGNSDSMLCSMSSNGRRVAFTSYASNLVSGPTSANSDIFLRDLDSGTTSLVSAPPSGAAANDYSWDCRISADGTKIAYSSFASNLVSGDTNSAEDIFCTELQSGSTVRISLGLANVQLNGGLSSTMDTSPDMTALVFVSGATNATPGDFNRTGDVFRRNIQSGEIVRSANSNIVVLGSETSEQPSISGDGQLIAFRSAAYNLIDEDTNNRSDIFIRNLATETTERVSLTAANAQSNGHSGNPAISRTGRYVAFDSIATNLVAGDTNASSDIYVRDRQLLTTTRVSTNSAGLQANGVSTNPSISLDGRRVVFASAATNLVTGDTNGLGDIFLKDAQTGETTRISVATDGSQSNGASSAPHISSNGRFVTFVSLANNLAPSDTNDVADIFVRDLVLNTTQRVSVSSFGAQSNAASSDPELSHDGSRLVFASDASNLVASDTNLQQDIFLRDLQNSTTIAVSVQSGGALGNGRCTSPSISADGGFVAFSSAASNLVAGDIENEIDIFVRDLSAGETRRVSLNSSGVAANLSSQACVISGNGSFTAFASFATNLTPLGRGLSNFTDIFVHEEVGASTTISGTLTFSDLVVSAPRPSVTFILAPTAGGPLTSVPGVLVLPDGTFSFSSSLVGEYDVYAKASTFLRKRYVGSVALSAGPVDWLSFVLTNGDSDGDNEVGIGDYSILSATYNLSDGDPDWDARGDLNGDGHVDITDYGVLAGSYGLSGD